MVARNVLGHGKSHAFLLGGLVANMVFVARCAATDGLDSLPTPGGGPPGTSGPATLGLDLVTPAFWPTTGQIPIELRGQGFASGVRVTIDDASASGVTVTSPNRITALLPASLAPPGPVPVMLTQLDGESVTRTDLFAYTASALAFGPTPFVRPESAVGAMVFGDVNGNYGSPYIGC